MRIFFIIDLSAWYFLAPVKNLCIWCRFPIALPVSPVNQRVRRMCNRISYSQIHFRSTNRDDVHFRRALNRVICFWLHSRSNREWVKKPQPTKNTMSRAWLAGWAHKQWNNYGCSLPSHLDAADCVFWLRRAALCVARTFKTRTKRAPLLSLWLWLCCERRACAF